MKRLPVLEEDRRSVAGWYARWGALVADVNFKPAREMFAEDVIAFGSKVEMMTSQAQLEAEQWRDRKSTRLNSSHIQKSRMPSSA